VVQGCALKVRIGLVHCLLEEGDELGHLGVALACGSPNPTAPNPISATNSSWKRVAYGKATLSAATAAWEGHRLGASKAPPPRTEPRAPTKFDDLFGGPAQEEDGNEGWGDSWGYCRPNTLPTDAGTHRTEAPVPAPVAPVRAPAAVPGGLDLPALISTLLKTQADAQLAQTNANHANLIAFQTATAQALAAKSGDKESKLTAAKKLILQACAGIMHANKFVVEHVYQDMDVEGGASDALGRILRKRLKPLPLSTYKTNIQHPHHPTADCNGQDLQLLLQWRQDLCRVHNGHHHLCGTMAYSRGHEQGSG